MNKRTFVLDFVNKISDIRDYFSEYYGGEIYLPSENETDSNILYKKRDKILDYHVVTQTQIDKIYDNINIDNSNSGELTSIVATVKQSYKKLDKSDKKIFTAELKKFSKLFYYISAVYNSWNEDMKKLAVVFDALYNVLYEKEDSVIADPEELIELIEFSTHIAVENASVLLNEEDIELSKVSTEVAINEKSFSLINDIVEKFNLKYANADQEINDIVDDLSSDDSLVINVRDSSPNAYESAVLDKVSSKITDGLLKGTLTGDDEKAAFYTELSSNKILISKITNAVIEKIKDLLMAG